jgi:hypothetical protein
MNDGAGSTGPPRGGARRRATSLLAGAALLLDLVVPAATASAGATVPAATCPPAPTAPPADPYYKLNGLRWNPSHTIDYVLDTKRLTAAGILHRVADIRTVMREMAAYSGLVVHYQGTEKAETSPRFSTVQFLYNSSAGESEQPYVVTVGGAQTDQMAADVISIGSSFGWGFGPRDNKDPLHSPEGKLLLLAVGNTVGLGNVPQTWRQAMNPDLGSARFWYGRYQGGDDRGLYEVGSVKGCTGFAE